MSIRRTTAPKQRRETEKRNVPKFWKRPPRRPEAPEATSESTDEAEFQEFKLSLESLRVPESMPNSLVIASCKSSGESESQSPSLMSGRREAGTRSEKAKEPVVSKAEAE